jgi:hypothetical protein
MTDPAGPFADSNFELLALTDHALPATSTSVVTVPISVTVPAGSTLVMEIDAANLNGVGRFLMGANGLGQTAPSYLRSASCGLPNPVDTATIGFPSFHMVMSVTGVAHSTCDAPHDTPWFSMSAKSGSVAPGGSQTVEVTFDSTGLTVGRRAPGDAVPGVQRPGRPGHPGAGDAVRRGPAGHHGDADGLTATQPAGTVGTQTLRMATPAPSRWSGKSPRTRRPWAPSACGRSPSSGSRPR